MFSALMHSLRKLILELPAIIVYCPFTTTASLKNGKKTLASERNTNYLNSTTLIWNKVLAKPLLHELILTNNVSDLFCFSINTIC